LLLQAAEECQSINRLEQYNKQSVQNTIQTISSVCMYNQEPQLMDRAFLCDFGRRNFAVGIKMAAGINKWIDG
jgi:hypothetical protein